MEAWIWWWSTTPKAARMTSVESPQATDTREARPSAAAPAGLHTDLPRTLLRRAVAGDLPQGVGAEVLWPQVASLALYAAVMVAMAVWRLRIRAE